MSAINHLDFFGQKLMDMVRDQSISKFERICRGEINSKDSLTATEFINTFSSEEIEKIRSLVVSSIDTSIFNMLNMLQYESDNIAVNITLNNEICNLVEISDGLGGELFGEFGWMSVYSRYGEPELV